MAEIAEHFRIRPLREEDFGPFVEIMRANFPDEPRSVEETRDQYHRFDSSPYAREYVVAEHELGRIVAVGFYTHVPWSFHPDKYNVYVVVHPDVQRQGVGSRLMSHLLQRLGERGASRLKSWAREDYPHAVTFLRRYGFEEYGRTFESRLEIGTVDLAPFAAYRAQAADAGVTITTLGAELDRDPLCLPVVYQAHCALDISAPRNDPDLPTAPPYERFLQHEVHHPRVLRDAFFLAKTGDFYVGESALKRSDADPAVLWQQLTAVLPEYRGHGIATTLKLYTVEYAQTRGYRQIRTFNSSLNGAMLAINDKFGFVRQPAWIDFLRAERA